MRVFLPLPVFPSYLRYFSAGDNLVFLNFLKYGGYDGYTETAFPYL